MEKRQKLLMIGWVVALLIILPAVSLLLALFVRPY
jgi:hypothetical protein